ncbi:pyridoxamine 5'-phosphate oxidase family protein [Microbacterium timonense]|uniref:pyridoxamine 5'-phosphate oxidase family protein n=1 Tax=Microbacterium timonense TaxID=2086576 RepID=UPI001F3A3BB0|nr:pyridoxamine 5'-phosphate oxidase family protein [Microbacterium timonense]
MRRVDRRLGPFVSKNWSEVRRYFENAAIVHLATLMPDGAPHSVPVWASVHENGIAVFMETGSRKDKNLLADPRAALSVTDPANALDMAFVRGRAVRRIEGADALPIVDRISREYTGDAYPLRTGLVSYVIQPEVSWSRDHSE